MPLTPAALRRLAYKTIRTAGPDWQQKMKDWWVIGLRRPDCVVARPVLAVPAHLLLRATDCALIDGAATGETIAVSVAMCSVRDDEFAALYHYLEQAVCIDEALARIAAATDVADVDEWPF
jgi:hypothetical protein